MEPEPPETPPKGKPQRNWGLIVVISLGLGVALGRALENLALGVGLGLGLALVLVLISFFQGPGQAPPEEDGPAP